ncbi:hypothetical protein LSAT2_011720 [Lamellibrachia satsuma]|nr:hypothetical protein LSAT2_011720 [Lamellibrachia satsuma]
MGVRKMGGKVSGGKATGAKVSQETGGKGDRLMGERKQTRDTTDTGLIPSRDTTDTGLIPSRDTTDTGLIPSRDMTYTGLIPSRDITDTGLIPSRYMTDTGLIPSRDMTDTGLISSRDMTDTGLIPSRDMTDTGLNPSRDTTDTGLIPSRDMTDTDQTWLISGKSPPPPLRPSDVDDVIQAKGLMDRGFLMKLSQLSVSPTEQFQMGVFLSLKTSKIQELMRASEDAVTNTYTLLETWIDSRKDVSNSPALFDQLSGAFQNIKRADMVEFVRCEQLHLLNEKLKRAKETVQLCKTRSNEQMRLVKVELRETKDELQETKEELRKSNEQIKVAKEELRQTKEELRKSNDLLRLEQSKRQTSEALPVTGRIKALKEVAEAGGRNEDQRALHVMSMLRGYGQPELWGHVSQHFVEEGTLDLSRVLSSTNLPDLLYLLRSGAASDVTELICCGWRSLPPIELWYYSIYNGCSQIVRGIKYKKVADRGATWSNDEVDTSIDVWGEEEVQHQLDGYTRNSHIFDRIVERMTAAEYDRTASQCRIKIKAIKREYREYNLLDSLDYNAVFAGEEAGRALGAVLAKMSTLCELSLWGCSLTDRSWPHIADGIIRGCQLLKWLICWDNELTNDSEETIRRLLTQLPHMKIGMAECGLTRPSERRLQAEFGGRIDLVSHFSVVIGPVTPNNYSTVTYCPPSSVSNSSTVTNCLKNDNFIKRRSKRATSKKRPALPLSQVFKEFVTLYQTSSL